MKASFIPKVRFRRVEGPGDPDREDFVAAYKNAARPGAFVWVYPDDDVENVLWRGNADHLIATARSPNGVVVGLVCCHPLSVPVEPKVHNWIGQHDLPFDPARAVVISALAVRETCRGHGIGTSLSYDALRWAFSKGYKHFLMQASVEVARRSDKLCFRLGARTFATIGGNPDPNPIVLPYGNISEALAGDECSH